MRFVLNMNIIFFLLRFNNFVYLPLELIYINPEYSLMPVKFGLLFVYV